MLTSIGLRNFKAFGDEMQEAPLSKITLIYGPNSGGKSSIIQALLLLKQSHEGYFSQGAVELNPRGRYVDLGSFPSLIHNHDVASELGISLKYNVDERALSSMHQFLLPRRRFPRFRKRFTDGLNGRIDLTFLAVESEGSNRKDSSELSSVRYRLVRDLSKGTSFDILLDLDESHSELSNEDSSEDFKFNWRDSASLESYARYAADTEKDRYQRQNRGDTTQEPKDANEWLSLLQSSYLEPDTYSYGLPSIIRAPDELIPRSMLRRPPITLPIMVDYRHHMENFTYLGPLRSYPERVYTVSTASRESAGVRGEFTPHILYYNPNNVIGSVNKWFEKFEIPYELDARPLSDQPEISGELITIVLALLDRDRNKTGVVVTFADVGFGINQILPVIIEGVASPRGSTICVEQPEIHIHPRLQAHLADLMIDTVSKEEKQWIVETHSELLILRLQRRIREGKIKPEDISVLYVDPNDESTEGSAILQLRIDEEGDFIDEWPHGFFDEGFNELIAEPEPEEISILRVEPGERGSTIETIQSDELIDG